MIFATVGTQLGFPRLMQALDRLAPGEAIDRDSVYWSVVRQYHTLGFHRLIIPKALGGLEEFYRTVHEPAKA